MSINRNNQLHKDSNIQPQATQSDNLNQKLLQELRDLMKPLKQEVQKQVQQEVQKQTQEVQTNVQQQVQQEVKAQLSQQTLSLTSEDLKALQDLNSTMQTVISQQNQLMNLLKTKRRDKNGKIVQTKSLSLIYQQLLNLEMPNTGKGIEHIETTMKNFNAWQKIMTEDLTEVAKIMGMALTAIDPETGQVVNQRINKMSRDLDNLKNKN